MGLYYDISKGWQLTNEKTNYKTDYKTDYSTNNTLRVYSHTDRVCQGPWYRRRCSNVDRYKTIWNDALNNENAIKNATNEKNNRENSALNQRNTALNAAYQTTLAAANGTKGGDYTANRQFIRDVQNVDADVLKQLEESYKDFYRNEKLQTWDSGLGAKPPYGDFDAKYYGKTYTDVSDTWKNAVANDDIDITERYVNENGFYLGHYTNQGKAAGNRGNAPEKTSAATEYLEKKPTDKDLQDVRNLQLGVDTQTQAERILNIPQVAEQWDLAKRDDPYWIKLCLLYTSPSPRD